MVKKLTEKNHTVTDRRLHDEESSVEQTSVGYAMP